MIFTGSRITYAMGTEHSTWARLGRWNARHGTPIWSLVVQALVTLALVLAFGLNEGAFERMVQFGAPVAWLFFTLVGVSLFVLRFRDRARHPALSRDGLPIYPLDFLPVESLPCLFESGSIFGRTREPRPYWLIGILLVGFVFVLWDFVFVLRDRSDRAKA